MIEVKRAVMKPGNEASIAVSTVNSTLLRIVLMKQLLEVFVERA